MTIRSPRPSGKPLKYHRLVSCKTLRRIRAFRPKPPREVCRSHLQLVQRRAPPWLDGISMLTREQVHFGNADQVIAGREALLREAWAAQPDRFVSE